MPPDGQDRYRPYLDQFTTMGESSGNQKLLLTPIQAAAKIADILDVREPRFKYNLAVDAKLVDAVITRLLPFSARAALNRRLYRLNQR